MDLTALVRRWDNELDGELVHLELQEATDARYSVLDPPLPEALASRLRDRGIERLYRHQTQAIANVRAGRHTVLVAGTAGGKTLCYQAPIVETLLTEPRSSALLIYPTKALAQDQLRSLSQFRLPSVAASTYDGDTPSDLRNSIRKHSSIILTNPDMLHFGILPYHAKWADFILRLRYIVIDEMHMFRGIFGSHVALILRRLRRIAALYGAHPTFVFTSATIGNPQDLAQRLTGLEVDLIEGNDAPTGSKLIALWNPPVAPDGRRLSPLSETIGLFTDLVREGRHTIVFSRSRKATELIYRRSAELLGPELAARIAPYRAGYLPSERRKIEEALFSGGLLGVAATNALELGIDVGNLDAAIINTFPGTIASFRQQAGRAGRTRRESIAILVGGEDALDQYFMNHPSELFTRQPEAAVINPNNPQIVEAHTACAAFESPLSLSDRDVLGDEMEEAANRLTQTGDLRPRDGRLHWSRRHRPGRGISIRNSGGDMFTIVSPEAVLGTLEQQRAFRDAHPGAVYLHQGDSYLVTSLDQKQREINVQLQEVDYYTQTKVDTALEILAVHNQGRLGKLRLSLGKLRVESHVSGFQRKKIGTGEVLTHDPLDFPPTVFETEGVWLTIPEPVLTSAGICKRDQASTLHAAEHAGIAMLPLFAICDRWDIGGLSTPFDPQTGHPTIYIYEGFAGGAGISPIVYQNGRRHWEATLDVVETCPCSSGCPSCVVSPKCGNFNEPLSKAGAASFLKTALS